MTVSTVVYGSLLTVCVAFAVQAPVFSSSSREFVALIGSDVTMECSVNDLNISEIVLWQNGSIVLSAGRRVYQPPESNKFSIEGSSDDMFNLQIRNVTIYDAGNYSCQVPGRGTQYSELVIHVSASIKFFPGGKTVTVVEESELSLTCIGSGKPNPVIEWLFHGKNGPQEVLEARDQETLMFSEIRRSSAGEYECRASNGVGLSASHKVEVVVEYAPSLVDRIPVIYVAPGKDATIECFFSANPDVDLVVWYHNSSKLIIDRQTNIKDSNRKTDFDVWALDIRELRPDQLGIYTCHGENKIGIVSGDVQLSPFPHDLKILSIRKNKYSEQHTIAWTVSSPMKLLNFVIALKQLNDSFNMDWHNFSIPVSVPHRIPNHSQEYVLQKLLADANYTVLMRARNLYGYSDWSESQTFHTSESRGTFAEPRTLLIVLLLAFLLLQN